MTRSPTEWWLFAAGRYSEIKQPNWRTAVPSKTQTQSQKRIWRACFHWARTNPGPKSEDTNDLMRRFIHSWMDWAKSQPDEHRTTIWTLLYGFMETLEPSVPEENPEKLVRAALQSMHKRAQALLLLKLLAEVV